MPFRFEPASSSAAASPKKKPMTLRDSKLGDSYYAFLNKHILPALEYASVSPNQLTISGLVFALLVPFGFYLNPGYGFALMLVSGIADTLDGALSRKQGNGSRYGAFLDSTTDRAADFSFLFGFWVLFWNEQRFLLATGLIFSGIFLTFLISYTKARAEGLNGSCRAGFMGRETRTIYLLIWAALLSLLEGARQILLWGGLLLFWGAVLATLIQRLAHISGELREQERQD